MNGVEAAADRVLKALKAHGAQAVIYTEDLKTLVDFADFVKGIKRCG